jgi:hypothetical protein
MIISLLLNFIANFVEMLTSIIPSVGVANIPFIGTQVAYYWSLGVGYMNTAVTIIPFTEIVWHSFLYIILPFEFSLLVAKFFFGSHLPSNG